MAQSAVSVAEFRSSAERLAEALKRLVETSEEEKASHEQALHRKEWEQVLLQERLAEAEERAAGVTARLSKTDEEESALIGDLQALLKANEQLLSRQQEALERQCDSGRAGESLIEAGTRITDEFRRLEEDSAALFREREEMLRSLRERSEETIQRMSSGAERLEDTLLAGARFAEKLEQLASKIENEHIPALYKHARAASPRARQGAPLNVALPLVFILFAVIAIAGFFLYRGGFFPLSSAAPQKEASRTQDSRHDAGTLRVVRDGFGVSFVFLTREAIAALSLSEVITEASQSQNLYGLLEIRAEKGCIPETFASAWAEQVSFADGKGGTVRPSEVGGESRVVYNPKACGGAPGPVFLRGIVTAAKGEPVKRVSIRGLVPGDPIVFE
jgi:hypothetical protein